MYHHLTRYILFVSLSNIHSIPLKYVCYPFSIDEEAEVWREGKVSRKIPGLNNLF